MRLEVNRSRGRVTFSPWGQTVERTTVTTPNSHFYCLFHLNLCCHSSPFRLLLHSPARPHLVSLIFYITLWLSTWLEEKTSCSLQCLKPKRKNVFRSEKYSKELWGFTSGTQWTCCSVKISEVMIILNFFSFEAKHSSLHCFCVGLPRYCLSVTLCWVLHLGPLYNTELLPLDIFGWHVIQTVCFKPMQTFRSTDFQGWN